MLSFNPGTPFAFPVSFLFLFCPASYICDAEPSRCTLYWRRIPVTRTTLFVSFVACTFVALFLPNRRLCSSGGTGPIPCTLGNLSRLKHLELQSNQLTGDCCDADFFFTVARDFTPTIGLIGFYLQRVHSTKSFFLLVGVDKASKFNYRMYFPQTTHQPRCINLVLDLRVAAGIRCVQ